LFTKETHILFQIIKFYSYIVFYCGDILQKNKKIDLLVIKTRLTKIFIDDDTTANINIGLNTVF